MNSTLTERMELEAIKIKETARAVKNRHNDDIRDGIKNIEVLMNNDEIDHNVIVAEYALERAKRQQMIADLRFKYGNLR